MVGVGDRRGEVAPHLRGPVPSDHAARADDPAFGVRVRVQAEAGAVGVVLFGNQGYKRELRNSTNRYGRPRDAGDIDGMLSVLSRAFRLAVDSGVTRANPFRLVARLDYRSRPFLVLETRGLALTPSPG
jgi:hypothetical protein